MGNNPSRQFYHAARRGDVGQMEQLHRNHGADINWKNTDKFEQTPLIAAAKHGRQDAVRWLLAKGALDYRTTMGETALAMAAKMGHHGIVAMLLDRGSDPFSQNGDGQRPIDQAASMGHVGVVRLIEARCCPFYGHLDAEKAGWFSSYYDKVWIHVSRARPWDNPLVDRREIKLAIYRDVHSAQAEVTLIRPTLLPLQSVRDASSTVGEVVEFKITPEATLVRGKPVQSKTYKARLPRAQYNWLQAVLSDSFGTGRGPAFDAQTGLVRKTEWGYAYEAQFNTQYWSQSRIAPMVKVPPFIARPDDTVLAQAQAQLQHAQQVQQPVAQPAIQGRPMAVPAAALIAAANQQQQQQQQLGWGHAAVAVALPAPSAPPAVEPINIGQQGMYPQMQQHRPATVVPAASAPMAARAAGVAAGMPQQAQAAVARPAPATIYPTQAAQAAAQRAGTPSYWTPALQELARQIEDGSIRFDAEPPEHFVCPITADIAIDPVVAADGHTYSRTGIAAWLALKKTSPKTNEVMASETVFPNHLLRGEILTWIEHHRVREGVQQATAQRGASAPSQEPVAPEPTVAYNTYPVAAAAVSVVPLAPSGHRGSDATRAEAWAAGTGITASAPAMQGAAQLEDDSLRAGHGSRSLSGAQAAGFAPLSSGVHGVADGQACPPEAVPTAPGHGYSLSAGDPTAQPEMTVYGGNRAVGPVDMSAWPEIPHGAVAQQAEATPAMRPMLG